MAATMEASATTLDRVDEIWSAIEKRSFAVVSYTTPQGDPRSAGVVYTIRGRRLFLVVGLDSWKARHIGLRGRVAVTIPVRRGGLLSLLAPIPPATISFHGAASVHGPDSPVAGEIVEALGAKLPEERRHEVAVIEIVPEGAFVTYGVGVPLMKMRDTEAAKARVAVAA